MKIVSIILTTYNSEKTLRRTLDSIFLQQGTNELFKTDLIVVDDCSTDGTRDILTKYNIDFYSTKINTGGPNTGRNIGLKNVIGDYICIVDHDDEWQPNRIISQLPYLDNVNIVTSGFTIIDELNNKKFVRVNITESPAQTIYYKKNETFQKLLKRSHNKGQIVYIGSMIYSSKLKHITFEEKHGMVDIDWLLRLFHEQSSCEICKSLYIRYVNNMNLSLDENYRLNDYSYSLHTVNSYSKHYPLLVKIAKKRINGSMARYYYKMGNMKKARVYFLKSSFNLKTFFYYITTFIGSKCVKKIFNVFG